MVKSWLKRARGLGGTLLLACLADGEPVPTTPALALQECRLEHPLHISSVAARCASLGVPLDRDDPRSETIALRVAVVGALNRRSAAAPLFVLAGGPGQSAAPFPKNRSPTDQ